MGDGGSWVCWVGVGEIVELGFEGMGMRWDWRG